MNEPLLSRWLDDRDALSDAETEELARRLESDPALASELKTQLALDDLLSRRLAVDRARFPDQVAQRVRASGDSDRFVKSTMVAARRSWVAELAAAVLLVAALVLFLVRREPSPPPLAPTPGLRGEYYTGRDFAGTPILRIDSTIDFLWPPGEGPIPAAGDVYCVRWTGLLLPRLSGVHQFRTRHDDGIRLTVNGQKVIDDWTLRLVVSEGRGSATLEAGKPVPIQIEYSNGGDLGLLRLYWTPPGQSEEIIPASQFRSP